MKKLFTSPAFWYITLAFSYTGTTNILVYTTLNTYLVHYQNQAIQTVSLVLSLSRISGLLMIFFAGIAMSRLNPQIVVLYTGIIAAVLTSLLGVVEGVSLLLLVFLQTFAISGFFPAIFVCLGNFFPGRFQNLVVTIMSIISQLFGALMPLVASAFSQYEKMPLFYVFLGIMMIPFILITLALRFTKPFPTEHVQQHS